MRNLQQPGTPRHASTCQVSKSKAIMLKLWKMSAPASTVGNLRCCSPQGRAASGNVAPAGRIPGDCYVWGSAAAGPAVALGIPATAWQHSLSPVLVDDSTHLDVRSVRSTNQTCSMLLHWHMLTSSSTVVWFCSTSM